MRTVAVVEDEQLVSKGIILTTDWSKFGCEVVASASNGLEGIEVIKRLKPDIVITDVRMPGLDGIHMIQQLRSDGAQTEFIIISGYSDFEYARQAIKLGVRDFLTKPIDDAELENALHSIVEAIHDKQTLHTIQDKISNLDDDRIQLLRDCVDSSSANSTDYVARAVKFISCNYQHDISIKTVAESLYISESYLSRLFKNKLDQTFVDYLTYFRIKTACSLLKEPDIKIYNVANMIGYKDQRYFSVIFKKLVGMTPKEFRDNLE